MSMFGDDNFKSDVYENLDLICEDEDTIGQLEFIHSTILKVVKDEEVNWIIQDYIDKRKLSKSEVLEDLGNVYSIMVGWDIAGGFQ